MYSVEQAKARARELAMKAISWLRVENPEHRLVLLNIKRDTSNDNYVLYTPHGPVCVAEDTYEWTINVKVIYPTGIEHHISANLYLPADFDDDDTLAMMVYYDIDEHLNEY